MNRKTLLLVAGGLVVLLLIGLGVWRWRATSPQSADSQPAATTAVTANQPGQPTFTATEHDNGFSELVPVTLTEDKTQLAKRYQTPYIKEFYDGKLEDTVDPADEDKHTAPLPAFNYQQSLAGKSYLDLLLLRNEVYARNGYCFLNPTARYHFAEKKWYRPLWSEPDYNENGSIKQAAEVIRVPLSHQEMSFVQRVHTQELQLLAHRETPQAGHPMVGLDFLTNQRDGDVAPAFAPALARSGLVRNNFILVPTREEQLFYLYDQNQYDYTPSFVTTDLVLQLLHKYLNGILSDVEEQRLVPIVGNMLGQASAQAQLLAQQSQTPQAREAAVWAAAYYAVGQGLLQKNATTSGAYDDEAVAREIASCMAATGYGSALLVDSMFDYTAFKPRGMYTMNDTTRRYFRTVKWLNTAPVFLDSDAGMLRALALAQSLAANPQAARQFATFTQVVSMLAGDEDNRSLTHLLGLLKRDYAGQTLDQLATPATLARLRQALVAAGTDRIRPKGASPQATEALDRPTLLFTAGRYSFDGEILSRLTNLKQAATGQYVRAFPKGLDVFASFGNRTAQDILLSHYHEAARWPAYPDTLRALQQQFGRYTDWNHNLYTKTMQMLLALNAPVAADSLPLFARTPAWQKRNLSTALGGWAELKHDLLLYTEQPMGAEGGGPTWGPPPPRHQGFVEPNLPFWDGALALLAQQDRSLSSLKVNTEHLMGLNKDMRELVTALRDMARKQLRHQPLTPEEQQRLSFVGGEVENLTIRILKTVQLPDRERHLGLVADVYTFNRDVLEEAVGAADAIYVAVEIDGTWVLARGAVFSYYEFQNSERLTDEEWRVKLKKQPPPRPTWLQDLIVPIKALNTQVGGPAYMQ
jgi:hypothetical protein